jgi:hypothetical protein
MIKGHFLTDRVLSDGDYVVVEDYLLAVGRKSAVPTLKDRSVLFCVCRLIDKIVELIGFIDRFILEVSLCRSFQLGSSDSSQKRLVFNHRANSYLFNGFLLIFSLIDCYTPNKWML